MGHLAGVDGMESVSRVIALLIQGMYQGVLATFFVGETPLNDIWWSYFLITLPALLTSTLGYIAGAKDFHITKMGIPEFPESDRPTRQELKEQKKLEKKNRK